ncbi:glycoside hydrolase family 8 protein [Tilletiaria anomala UBC 951]|uniref:Glycoside hydrolase family 8 protein n=1 Tax=Tilletiaria anomala (strain ATCC 24038 / CBS 436.72 / UBC 951) TaxID=1037660 RepID=A0A066WCE5_TILAU|nr:glycoside hydrolase family 8 protein [Tilletiaria anomala UBC 951]KDN51401.1 glycoside hydrolase family 8 protein [Tilletiaria anomala UBC 951]
MLFLKPSQGDNGNAITCSEAHGYAMLISVMHRNQPDFDQLLRFFLAFRNDHSLMKWQVKQDSHRGIYCDDDGQTSATDGDIDVATALFLAGKVFADSPVFSNSAYWTEGNRLASAILRYEIHPRLGTPLLGDWANEDGAENVKLYNSTRTSDFILSSFLLFHRVVADAGERSRWQWVIESTLSAALSQLHRGVLLLPDFLVFNLRTNQWEVPHGKLLESEKGDGQMSWNACRTPWRLAHYYAASGDQRIRPLLERMREALVRASGKWPAVPAGIDIRTGRGLEDYSDRAFIAPAGYVCHVLGDTSSFQQAVTALNDEEPSYFGDSIDLVIAEQASHTELFR